jgi:hypothetical protein
MAATTTTTLPPGESSIDVPLEGGDGTVEITTEAGEVITDVSTAAATNAPGGLVFPFGTISYTTTSPVGGSVTMSFEFSSDLPDNLVIYKVDNNGNYNELPTDLWKKLNSKTVEVTLTDGDALTDQDGVANGFIEDPMAVGGQQSSGGGDTFDFGGGGCTLSTTRSTATDPIWLFLLLAPGLGILRRRTAATRSAKTKRG